MTEARGEILWTPPPDVRETTRIGRVPRLARADARPASSRGTRTCGSGRSTTSTAFWLAVTEWSGVRWHDRTVGRARRAGDARRAVVPGRHAELRRARAGGGGDPSRRRRGRRARARPARRRSSRGRSSPTRWRGAGPGWCASASDRATGSPRTCPTSPRPPIAFLATASLGAIWSSCAPEFGVRSVVDRFAQIEPVVLLAVDGYRYGEKVVDKRADVAAIEAALPTRRHTVHVRVPR